MKRDLQVDSLRLTADTQLLDAGKDMTSVKNSMRDERCPCQRFTLPQAKLFNHICGRLNQPG